MNIVETNFKTIMDLTHFDLTDKLTYTAGPNIYEKTAEMIAEGPDLFFGGVEFVDTGNGYRIEDGYQVLMTLLIAKKALYDLQDPQDFGEHALQLNLDDDHQKKVYAYLKQAFSDYAKRGISVEKELGYYKAHVGMALFIAKTTR